MNPAIKTAIRADLRKCAEVFLSALLAGVAAAAFLVPVGAVALVVRWLW